jgi:predicted RNase H-like HicB family nuclease
VTWRITEGLPADDTVAVASGRTVHGNVESGADLAHSLIAQPPEAFDKNGNRDAFDRVEVDYRPSRDRIDVGLQHDFAGKAAHGRGARCDEDEAWVADVPDLVYCSALGDTPHDAVAEAEVAIGALLDAARSTGRPLPEPSSRAARA